MKPEKLSRPWLSHSLRLSVFPVAPWQAPANLWESAVGEPPETDQNQARQFIRAQGGPWAGGILQVLVTPLRIDWLASPALRTNDPIGPDHRLIADVLPAFLDATRPWLTSADFEIKRVAFGLQGVLSADDKAGSYKLLQAMLPHIKIDPGFSSDFVYQINHPVQSRSLDLKLNRLTRWSALAVQFIMGEGGGAQSTPVPVANYASLECDDNTPAERQERLGNGHLGAIYDELVDLAWENLELGEIA
jgi:hypothetical protein